MLLPSRTPTCRRSDAADCTRMDYGGLQSPVVRNRPSRQRMVSTQDQGRAALYSWGWNRCGSTPRHTPSSAAVPQLVTLSCVLTSS